MFPIAHFAIGSSVMIVILILVELKSQYNALIIIVSGFWAMVPDVSALWHNYTFLENNIFANIFWFHQFIDSHLSGAHIFECWFLALFLFLVYFYCRISQNQKPENIKDDIYG